MGFVLRSTLKVVHTVYALIQNALGKRKIGFHNVRMKLIKVVIGHGYIFNGKANTCQNIIFLPRKAERIA